ncbi:carbohydrate ABC transporter permease [Arthrobacter castelli]|uniref:carbohydrate ABC transporter permease n=1 Tax=Arthrobacter castelli TaxID=271431 RepID=UPI000685B17B|nr:carbohydrate ABC transporter permease [Arthrobacter castelli]
MSSGIQAPSHDYTFRASDKRRPRDLLVIVPTFILLLLLVFPVLWMVFTSLRPASALIGGTGLSELFVDLGFDSYVRLFQGSDFARFIGNSLLISLVSTTCTLILASVAAYGFSRFRFRGRYPLLLVVLATQLVPFVVLITPVYLFFSTLGLLNTYFGLIIVYVAMTLPLATYLMLGFLNTVPRMLDEAARVDGCNTLQAIFRVILPVAVPGLVSTGVTTFIATWEEFLFASVFLTDPNLKTVQVGLYGFFGEYATDWGVIMAAATISAIPTIVLFSIIQRRLITGVAAGSVKE